MFLTLSSPCLLLSPSSSPLPVPPPPLSLVCFKMVGKFLEQVDADSAKNEEEVFKSLRSACKSARDRKDKRFCYYVGASPDSASSLMRAVAKPLMHHLPADKICSKLRKKDMAICELRYKEPIDLDAVDLKKMRVRQLKDILSEWGEVCAGCAEKRDFVNRINELRPIHAPSKKEL
jgi:mesencephalic astrocyte-derived neurotrophic factor